MFFYILKNVEKILIFSYNYLNISGETNERFNKKYSY